MYCIESLLRNKKYFEFLRTNKRVLTDHNFEDAKGSSQSVNDTLVKLHRSVLAKLGGEFEDLDKPSSQGFDLTKLEAMKEKSTQNFFQDMNKIKTGKGGMTGKAGKTGHGDDDLLGLSHDVPMTKRKTPNDDLMGLQDDLSGLGFGEAKANVVKEGPKSANTDDLLNIGFDMTVVTPTISAKTPSGSNYTAFDLDDLVVPPKNPTTTPVPNYHSGFDPLLSFQVPAQPTPHSHHIGGSPGNFLSDDKLAQTKKTETANNDPFNFDIAF